METGKNVAVIGLKDTGFLSALFLKEQGYQVLASDFSLDPDVQKNVKMLCAKGIEAEFGRHTYERIFAADWYLLSPGIPPSAEIYKKIISSGKPVVSEIEVASWFSRAKAVVAVTGSCGKTTTATLLSQIIIASGEKVVLCGNIGNPWIGELTKIDRETTVVLEVSSFQLVHCSTFAPDIGLLLNVYPNHMDWHADMKEYAEAKLKLFRSMTESGFMICRKSDENAVFPDFRCRARRVYFDQVKTTDPNRSALLCAAQVLGVPEHTVDRVLSAFGGLEHRLEKFAERDGVIFINDSKCTTPASLAWALEKYPDQKVVLVCGGKAKSRDFRDLRDLVARKVKCVVLIGTAKSMIADSWREATEIIEAASFDEACDLAVQKSLPQDVVILSPACASFDMFRNYQERGRLFKEMILERLNSEAKT